MSPSQKTTHSRQKPAILAHLQNTTSTPTTSSNITAWIDQLPDSYNLAPSPKSRRPRPSAKPLAPVSSNPQRLPTASSPHPPSPAGRPKRKAESPSDPCRKKRRISAKPVTQPSTALVLHPQPRRSARIASTIHRMSKRNTAQGRGNHVYAASGMEEALVEEEADEHGIITRGRRRARHGLLAVSNDRPPLLDGGPIPYFSPQTPSRRSGNASKSASPSKTGRKKSISPKKSDVSESGSTSTTAI